MFALKIEYIAMIWFLLCWVAYSAYAKSQINKRQCLASMMHGYRQKWAYQIVYRENRMADVASITTLERTASFFASSSLLILAALATALGAVDKSISIINEISFKNQLSSMELELLIGAGLVIFVYSFFKFTWSIRQYSFAVAMVGALPSPSDTSINEDERQKLAKPIARTVSAAAFHFNEGLRSYYFSLALFAWFISTWLFMFASVLIVYELHRREFRSRLLKNFRPD